MANYVHPPALAESALVAQFSSFDQSVIGSFDCGRCSGIEPLVKVDSSRGEWWMKEVPSIVTECDLSTPTQSFINRRMSELGVNYSFCANCSFLF